MKWTTAAAITEQVQKRWDRGQILAARLNGETLFPLELRLKRPSPKEIAGRFGEVQDWIRELSAASRESRGFGFELRRETVRNQVQVVNTVPVAAILPSEADALRLIRKQQDAQNFHELAELTLARLPQLREWLTRRPLVLLEEATAWKHVLAVLEWFTAHPRSGLYLRQLDVPGVDTKFIEARRSLLTELLDSVLPQSAIDDTVKGAREFQQRFGLRSESPLIRFRLLDPALYISGLSDLSLPPEQFAILEMPLDRVFVTENRTNGVAFPDCPAAMVVFGLGYGLERLANVAWLRQAEVHYWGDIDTHGFGILNRLRGVLPDARSFLMDRDTLNRHRSLWTREPADNRYSGEPTLLTSEERSLFHDLRSDRLGERIRLEQERISYGWLEKALTRFR